MCPRLLYEVRKTLLAPRIARKYAIAAEDVDAVVTQFEREGMLHDDPVDQPRVVPKDANDDYLVALALASGVDVLVSCDKHFDNVEVAGLRIMTPAIFLRELR